MSNEQELPEAAKDEQLKNEIDVASDNQGQSDENANVPQPDVQQQDLSVELQKKLEVTEQKAAENWDRAVRIQAEMENLKKRIQKDLENAHKFALENFAKELLVVLDSLELGLQAAGGESPEVQKFREGSELTIKQFEAVFAKFNIEVVNPIGQPFNPELHQAMAMQPSADAEPNSVLNVFQKGYVLNGRLLRPAMVVVAKAEEKLPENTPKIDEQA